MARHPIELIGAFESTYMPAHDRDVFETTEHDQRWRADLALLQDAGVTRLRYPIRWHRVEATEGTFDWAETDEVLGHLRSNGFRPIVDLVHHTSYPAWLTDGFADARFAASYLRYAEAFARRYPWVEEYTLFNEPFSTLFLCGHEAIWPPYRSGMRSFVDLLANVIPALTEASRLYRRLLPSARHVWTDTCEFHTGSDESGQRYADMANERRFLAVDAFLGRGYDQSGPVGELMAEAGGERLLDIEPGFIDVLGLDYYAHCQWNFGIEGGTAPTPTPLPLADQIGQYWERYGLPCAITETNVRGSTADRATWFKYVLEQCEVARDRGIPLEGLCWFPVIDSTDWDSLLFRCEGHIDPVGVYWLDEKLERHGSVMATSYAAAARGVPASELPAFELGQPVATWLQGYLPQLSSWTWQPPPAVNLGHSLPRPTTTMELRLPMSSELIVLSHLRWDWVWQRPQQLVSRFSSGSGRRTWFVEEPMPSADPEFSGRRLRREEVDGLSRVWLEIPDPGHHVGFFDDVLPDYIEQLPELVGPPTGERVVWIYTPLALEAALALNPTTLVYDVMDDLAAFKDAAPELVVRQRQALRKADVVFAGGRSLHRSVVKQGRPDAQLFPSGVSTSDYAGAAQTRKPNLGRPVAGYVGVLDERLDLQLIADLAASAPDWDIRMIGPVTKIDPASLPQAPNISYLGFQPYSALAGHMAELDVAIMPFALNEATKSISPTKTLEYLASGLPIVSTRVPDVVSDFGEVVTFAEDGAGFAAALEKSRGLALSRPSREARRLLKRHDWDRIAERMEQLVFRSDVVGGTESEATA